MTHNLKKFKGSLVERALTSAEEKEHKDSYGKMDGSMVGYKKVGLRKNKTSACRNNLLKKRRLV